ncbi:LLM class flavin-dependent oxidoreductase [Streptomyces sp. NPDC002889]|uniref:LLM class flavin-dependent oxidoreductase n=1 Tax=Streptomyces sp. NPDC002889 TaxID=3364669 RepID=UPI003692FD05
MTLSFGGFLPPFHEPGEDPHNIYWRDLGLVEWLEELGFDEAWVGEHHSAGWAPISSPELFMAAAAERTHRIKLGTGVVSLPYHNPLTVANRIVQLDHQSRGRVLFGMGAGVLPSDAYMMGISPVDQRRMMTESLDAIMHLFHSDEPLTRKTDWFNLQEARLHLRPYNPDGLPMVVASSGSTRSMELVGRYGLSPLTFATGMPGAGAPPLGELWQAAEASAVEHGQTVDRKGWRVVISAHVAESREEALNDVRAGVGRWINGYFRDTIGLPIKLPEGREVEAMVASGSAIVGTVEDAIAAIEKLEEISGGFGTVLFTAQDWAPREKLRRSYELIARYVVPHFRGSVRSLKASQEWVAGKSADFAAMNAEARRQSTD